MNAFEIEQWLKEKHIQDYSLNNDLSVNVHHGLSFNPFELKEGLPFAFHEIDGNLMIANNNLFDMRNFPRIVHGNVDVFGCDLYSLKGCPEIIHGNLIIGGNLIRSFQYIAKHIDGDIQAYDNALEAIDYLPDYFGGLLKISSYIPGNWDNPYGIKPDRIEYFIDEFNELYSEDGKLILKFEEIQHHRLERQLTKKADTISRMKI